MASPRVLLVDTTLYSPSSPMFAEALDRAAQAGLMAGTFIDEAPAFGPLSPSPLRRILRRVRPWPSRSLVSLHQAIVARAAEFDADIVLVVKGSHLTRACLTAIKATGATLVNFATDDPFNSRTSSATWRQALPLYDLVCSPRMANIGDLRSLGAPDVHFVPFGYKPEVHFREDAANEAERDRFHSDVCFIGGADADRIAYFEYLIDRIPGVKLALYGGYWNRSPRLAPFWRGFAIGREFRLAIAGAAISVNLVRRANRDDHVMRTFEIPACGGCLLTESTPTHHQLFEEAKEAFFFDSPSSFVSSIQVLLGNPMLRERAADAGSVKVAQTGNRYDDRLLTIVRLATSNRQSQRERSEAHAVSA